MVARYYEDLLRFCMYRLRDTESARDVVQEAYTRFLAAEQAGNKPRHPGALLRQIARHLIVDMYRRDKLRNHEDINALDSADQPMAPAYLQPEEALASMQTVQAYVDTIENLPPRCRQAFTLHVFDGLSHAEIASRMNISYSMVEKHIVRGLLACRACERQLAEGKAAPLPPKNPAGRQ